MHATRLGSFNALDQQLRMPARWEPWVGKSKPSIRTIERSLETVHLDGQREMLIVVAQEGKRKKVFHRLYPDTYWVGALDGEEPYASFKRCCPKCLTREIKIAGEPVTQYYHRYVVLQLVGVKPALLLDIEPLFPGETETTAGLRLMERFHNRCPRLIDVLTLDAFYLQAPFVKKVSEMGYYQVIVLKQENRDLYQDVDGLCRLTPCKALTEPGGRYQVWDIKDLTSWSQLGRSVRVVRSLEKKLKRERVAKKRSDREVAEDWRWAVISPQGKTVDSSITDEMIIRWGHARWDEETRGFGELTQYWDLDHNYHHHPNAMLANLLILFLVFFLTTVFFDRNLKAPQREGRTRLHLSQLFMDDLILQKLESFWTHPP